MGILNQDPKDKKSKDLRQYAVLLTIPVVLVVGPLIGVLGGQWLDKKFNTNPVFLIIGTIFGFASAGMETYKMIKKAQMFEKENENSK